MNIPHTEHFSIRRKIVASQTTDSWRHIPHVSYLYEPEITAFYETYQRLFSHRREGEKVTFNTLMLKVICQGLRAAPAMNAHITYHHPFVSGHIDTLAPIHISMPTILPDGKMMTLTLRDFGDKDLEEMSAYIRDIRRRTAQSDLTEAMYAVAVRHTLQNLRKGKLLEAATRLLGAHVGSSKVSRLQGEAKRAYAAIPETQRLTVRDLLPGTVTVSNIGSLYPAQRGTLTLLEVIPPQVCAISLGAVQDRPVVVTAGDGQKRVEAGKVLPMCIAFDHRALDFGEIVPFLQALDGIFAQPEIMSGWTKHPCPAAPSSAP